MPTDSLSAIDNKALPGASQTWQGHSAQTEVIAGWQWVRLAHVGEPIYVVLLKIAPGANEHDAVHALEWWLRSPGREDGDVVEVM